MDDINEMASVMKKYSELIRTTTWPFYVKGNIPLKNIGNAIRAFAPDMNASLVIGFYDTSFNSNGKCGYVFTIDTMYYKETFSTPMKVKYSEIKKIEIDESKPKEEERKMFLFLNDGRGIVISSIYLKKTPLKMFLEEVSCSKKIENNVVQKKVMIEPKKDNIQSCVQTKEKKVNIVEERKKQENIKQESVLNDSNKQSYDEMNQIMSELSLSLKKLKTMAVSERGIKDLKKEDFNVYYREQWNFIDKFKDGKWAYFTFVDGDNFHTYRNIGFPATVEDVIERYGGFHLDSVNYENEIIYKVGKESGNTDVDKMVTACKCLRYVLEGHCINFFFDKNSDLVLVGYIKWGES